jgi:hypothetical protein
MKSKSKRAPGSPGLRRPAHLGKLLIAGGVALASLAALSAAGLTRTAAPAVAQEVVVYKSPTCVCCGKWVEHMQQAGFRIRVESVPNVAPVKEEHGVPALLGSCHTAVADGYALEGHVPADDIRRLLEERPAIAGIAVPGMPAGSPGMDSPRREPYEVIAFQRDGTTAVFSRR